MPFSFTDLNVLVIEDNLGDFHIIQEFLEVFNSYITHTTTFTEAKPTLLKGPKKYDVILLDLSLPDKSGENLVNEVVKIAGKAPVIVLTGYSGREFGIRMLSLGISDYLLKDDLTAPMLHKSITYSIERKRIGLQLKEAEESRKKYDQEITKAIIHAQEQERLEIGRELHDNVNQLLAASKINLRLAKDETTKEKSVEWINNSSDYISLAIDEIRRLSHQLTPASFHEKSMREAFGDLVRSINPDNRFMINLKFKNFQEDQLNADLKLNLFRILQEQLKNILKHANATTIDISIIVEGGKLKMRIYDNGKGFDSNLLKNGIGLSNIKKRTELFVGEFIINSSVGQGCEVLVNIPLKQPH
jgi:signal transduction histidine kinase